MKLEIKNLTHYFNHPDDYLYKDVNMSFQEGKIYGIVGDSGSGKTTLLSFLAGLDVPVEGGVYFNDENIKKIGLEKFRNKDVSIVFQSYNLLNYMTAEENILSALSITDSKNKGDRAYVIKLLNRVGIDNENAKKNVQQLSGGQQQRVAIARALAVDAQIVIADEPTGNLDQDNSKIMVKLFQEIAHQEGKMVIIVTHDMKVARATDQIVQLEDRKFTVLPSKKKAVSQK